MSFIKPLPDRASQPDADDLHGRQDETKMRKALGLHTGRDVPRTSSPLLSGPSGPITQRRRFVKDGEVPVVLAERTSPVNRMEIAEKAVRAERDARERAERLLDEARAAVKQLQTQLGHLSLARDEAVNANRASETARLTVQAALDHALEGGS